MTRPKVSDLTYSPPCTACGEDDHARPACPYPDAIPTIVGYHEVNLPDVVGWRWSAIHPDGSAFDTELLADPYDDHRLSTYAMRRVGPDGAEGRWTPMRWRGRQPIGGIDGARRYALAFAHGADLPPTTEATR